MAYDPSWFYYDGQYYKSDPVKGNVPVTQADIDAYDAQQQQTQQQSQDASRAFIDEWRGYGDPNLGDLFNSSDYQGPTTRGTAGVDQQGLYNWGNGQSSWVPMGDSRFTPAPQHADSLNEAWGDWNSLNKNGGHMIPILALTAGTASSALGASGAAVGEGTGAAIGGAGAAEGVGAGSAVAGGTAAGGGTLAGTSGAATLTGSAAGDTLGGSAFVGDIPVAGEAGTSIYGTAGTGLDATTVGTAGTGATAGGSTLSGSSGTGTTTGNAGANTMSDGYTGNNNDPGYMYDAAGNPATAPGTQAPDTSSGGLSWTDLYNFGAKYGPQAQKFLQDNKGLLGGILGAAAGASTGGAKPAGVTTTTQDLPDWLKPYVTSNVQAGSQVLSGINPNNPLLGQAQAETAKTIGGGYLDPNSNPYLKATYDQGAKALTDSYLSTTQPRTDAMFSKAGAFGNGNSAYMETVARNQFGLGNNLKDLATNVFGGNYNAERTRQAAMTSSAPQFVAQSNDARFSPFKSFQTLFPNVSATSTPYFNNPLGNTLGGAMAGYGLGKAFG